MEALSEKGVNLVKEVVSAVRKKSGDDFPIILRISQWKLADYEAKLANNPDELQIIVDILVEAGVDIFHCSSRRFWVPEFEGSSMNLAVWVKNYGKPTITVGSVGLEKDFITTKDINEGVSLVESLEKLSAPISNNEYDLVAVGRGLISIQIGVKLLKKVIYLSLNLYFTKI